MPSYSHIKICGLTSVEAVQYLASVNCGYNGFIAYPPSPRHVSPETAGALSAAVGSNTKKVLVTVDAEDSFLEEYIRVLKPDMLQLHGNESPARAEMLRQRYHLPIIKAIAVALKDDLHHAQLYASAADMLLLDTKKPDGSSGGSGATFEWSILQGYASPLPYFLSGGIGAHNASQALATGYTPFLDVSSALEEKKGIKSLAKMKDFFDSLS